MSEPPSGAARLHQLRGSGQGERRQPDRLARKTRHPLLDRAARCAGGRAAEALGNPAESRPAMSGAPPVASAASAHRAPWALALGALALVALLAGAGIFLLRGAHTPSASARVIDKSIAVLPFTDMSQAHDQEFFADGMAEQILDVLAKIPSLKVIARTSSFQFKGKPEDVRVVGETLGVSTLLEGSIRKSGERLRITAQLIRTADGSQLWSEVYDREVRDVFRTQDEIADAVVGALRVSLLGAPEQRPASAPVTWTRPSATRVSSSSGIRFPSIPIARSGRRSGSTVGWTRPSRCTGM